MTTPRGAVPREPSKVEQAQRLTSKAFDELVAQLESGSSESLQKYLRACARFHRYSFGNMMLILAQQPDATRVAGFQTWRSLGRNVRKGEKGLVIIAPVKLRRGNEDEDEEDAKPAVRFRATHVFDIAQTEGEPLPEITRVSGDPGKALELLEEAVISSGLALATVESFGGADGVSYGGRIELREGLDSAERFSTLVHEWAHELLHQVPVNERPPKRVKETEAEAVAFIVGNAVGLETGLASADYIGLYRGDAETLRTSLDRIQRTAQVILGAVLDDEPTLNHGRKASPSVRTSDAQAQYASKIRKRNR